MNISLYTTALEPFLAETERLRPAECEVIDAHTHLGLDEDGRSLTLVDVDCWSRVPGSPIPPSAIEEALRGKLEEGHEQLEPRP